MAERVGFYYRPYLQVPMNLHSRDNTCCFSSLPANPDFGSFSNRLQVQRKRYHWYQFFAITLAATVAFPDHLRDSLWLMFAPPNRY